MKHDEVIKFLQDEIRSLDKLSTPNRHTITQLYADENIAMAVKIHSAIHVLETIEALTSEREEMRNASNALLHQIDIGDFMDSHGHSAKMLSAVHDLMKLTGASK